MQAVVEGELATDPHGDNCESMVKALDWLDKCQIQENPINYEAAYRHRTKGAWPFSTKEQNYTVSDCTAEGLKAVLYLQEHLTYVDTAFTILSRHLTNITSLGTLRNSFQKTDFVTPSIPYSRCRIMTADSLVLS